jgi:hypothetical protein
VPRSQTETYPLTDPAFLEDPYPAYRRMRQHDAVYWSEALAGRQGWKKSDLAG